MDELDQLSYLLIIVETVEAAIITRSIFMVAYYLCCLYVDLYLSNRIIGMHITVPRKRSTLLAVIKK